MITITIPAWAAHVLLFLFTVFTGFEVLGVITIMRRSIAQRKAAKHFADGLQKALLEPSEKNRCVPRNIL